MHAVNLVQCLGMLLPSVVLEVICAANLVHPSLCLGVLLPPHHRDHALSGSPYPGNLHPLYA